MFKIWTYDGWTKEYKSVSVTSTNFTRPPLSVVTNLKHIAEIFICYGENESVEDAVANGNYVTVSDIMDWMHSNPSLQVVSQVAEDTDICINTQHRLNGDMKVSISNTESYYVSDGMDLKYEVCGSIVDSIITAYFASHNIA